MLAQQHKRVYWWYILPPMIFAALLFGLWSTVNALAAPGTRVNANPLIAPYYTPAKESAPRAVASVGTPTRSSTPTFTSTGTSTYTPTPGGPTLTPTITPGCGLAWNFVNNPNLGAVDNAFNAVAAISASDIWAVGSYYSEASSSYHTLTEHWDGSSWTVIPSPNVGAGNNTLSAVTALSASDVWAVGYYQASVQQTLTLHWDGSSWSVVSSPSVGSGKNYLLQAAAISASDVWAIGYSCASDCLSGSAASTLVEHWDGSGWSVVPSPNIEFNNYLWSMVAVSANDIWVTGYSNTCYGCIGHTLFEHWNGSQWSVVSSPNTGTSTNSLYGMAATSTNDVWAAGHYYIPGTSQWQTLILHWDGTQWSIVPSPNLPSGGSYLQSMAAVAANDIWAVGYSYNRSGLTLHWDGTNWTIVSSPNVVSGNVFLGGVAAVSSQDVWAVGYNSNGLNQTLIQRYFDLCGTPTPTITPGGPTLTPTNTPTNILTPTSTPTTTGTQFTTSTPTPTHPLTCTLTSTPTRTETPTITLTPTGTPPTRTPTRTNTLTVTPTRSATFTSTPTNGPCVQPITEGFESGTLGLFNSTGSPGWSATTSDRHIGTYAAFAPDAGSVTDQRLTTNSTIVVPLNSTQATLSFWHRYDFEMYGTTAWDGGVLEISNNGGLGWNNPQYGFIGGYNGVLVNCPSLNPLAGRSAWVGSSGGWTQVAVDLTPYRGQTLLFRFRLGTDESGSAPGWWIDDVSFTFMQSTCFTPTLTNTPTNNSPTLTATLTATGVPPTNTPTASYTRTPTGATPTTTPSCTSLTWNVVSSPNVGTSDNTLFGAAVVSPNDVWAVGYYSSGGHRTMIQHWDGTQWSVVPSPNGAGGNELRAVAANAPNDIWAVGFAASGTLVEHWDGSAWTIISSPGVGVLYGVAAVSVNDVWAVGATNSSSQPLIIHWNGSGWSTVPSPGSSLLYGVAAVSANNVWAVGYNGPQTLVEHWDGANWSIVPSPNTGTSSLLQNVAVVSANDIWADGYSNSGSALQTLVEHWDGSAWGIVASPNPGALGNELAGIAAISASDIWAVGERHESNGPYLTLMEHWNGTNWSVVSSPNSDLYNNYLYGAAAASSSDVWAVGIYWSGPTARTQVLRYTGPCATATSTPTSTPGGPTQTSTSTNSATLTPTPTYTPTGTNTPCGSCTNTPTNTPTGTPTGTPTTFPTCGPGSDYVILPSSGATIDPGTTLVVGSQCDDCASAIFLPFTYNLYGTPYTIVNASSNGNLQFGSGDPEYSNSCLPNPAFNDAILPHWDDLMTDQSPDQGVYTSVTGIAPNRIFNIEWRACLYASGACGGDVNFEARLYEGQDRFDLVYGTVTGSGAGATVGVQRGTGASFTQYSCNAATLSPGLQLTFRPYGCGEPTITTTPTATRTPTVTFTPSNTPLPPTNTHTHTPTGTPTRTSTPLPTNTTTSTPTVTFTPGGPPTDTPTPTTTFTVTNTATTVPTSTNTGTPTATRTSTNTQVPRTNTSTSTPTSPTSPTSTVTATRTSTQAPTNTPTATSTRKPAAPRNIDGHVTWEGHQGQPSPYQMLPISLTLKLGPNESDYPYQNTDASGYFTVSVNSLVNGTYNWRVKGPKYLANSGTFALTNVSTTYVEMGVMRVGDANDDNVVNIIDFTIMKATFGKSVGDPGYDDRADFNGDQVVSIADFNLMKLNFGLGGAPPVR